ncbi:MAG: DUF423 domain-containing protein [Candidatus Synoicihabitans palmerolidicus]|nr:DUF423 domain-containing protein [Candidatus Synoicihabitans palmerolidicus]
MKNIPLTAAVLALLGVLFGSFGAHALRDILTQHDTTSVWETAVLYHLIHSVAAWALGQKATDLTRSQRVAGRAWLMGVLLFSGSLYCLALGGPRWLGPITPLGGIAFIIGWIAAAVAAKFSATSH